MSPQEYTDLFIKLIVAFFIPLGWAMIFYPFIRKIQKPRYALVIAASILSFFMLVFKEIMDEIIPFFDEILTYALGVFFGIAVLSFFFNFKSRWLEALPKNDIFFRKYKVRRKICLRHLFQAAILIEEKGNEFYDRFAEKIIDVNAKNLYRKLAREEEKHKKLFREILFQWKPLPIDREYLISFINQELEKIGIFLYPPPLDAREKDIARYAIEQEKKSAEFYLSYEKAFPEAWKKMHIQRLVIEERGHAKRLIAFYPQLNIDTKGIF